MSHDTSAAYGQRVIMAQRAVATAESGLRRVVGEARTAGPPWTVIGAALGISRQAAQQRFGSKVMGAAPTLTNQDDGTDTVTGSPGWMSAVDTREAITAALAEANAVWAWKMLLQGRDHLTAARDTGPWWTDPGRIPDRRWDLLFRAVIRRTFTELHERPPTWTRGLLPLREPWLAVDGLLPESIVRERTPGYLARLNIWVTANDLVTQ